MPKAGTDAAQSFKKSRLLFIPVSPSTGAGKEQRLLFYCARIASMALAVYPLPSNCAVTFTLAPVVSVVAL